MLFRRIKIFEYALGIDLNCVFGLFELLPAGFREPAPFLKQGHALFQRNVPFFQDRDDVLEPGELLFKAFLFFCHISEIVPVCLQVKIVLSSLPIHDSHRYMILLGLNIQQFPGAGLFG